MNSFGSAITFIVFLRSNEPNSQSNASRDQSGLDQLKVELLETNSEKAGSASLFRPPRSMTILINTPREFSQIYGY